MEVNQEVSGMIDDLVRDSLGSILTVGREKKQLTVREVAELLRLMPYQIESLEKEDFSIFKAEIFIKSYLRNYAALLDLDPASIIALYESSYQTEQSPPVITRPRPIHMPTKKRYVGVFGAICIVVLLWFMNSGTNTDNTQAVSSLTNSATDKQASQEPELEAVVSDVAPEVVAPAIPVQPKLNEDESVDVEAVIAEALINESQNRLELSFSAECWVEIVDAEGKVLLADLKQSGDKVRIEEGKPPFKVLLGYAPAVQLSYNGEAVTISTKKDSQSAKFEVGGI